MNRLTIFDEISGYLDSLPNYKILFGSLNGESFQPDSYNGNLENIKDLCVNGIKDQRISKKGILIISSDNKERYFLPLGGENVLNLDLISFCKEVVNVLQNFINTPLPTATGGPTTNTGWQAFIANLQCMVSGL